MSSPLWAQLTWLLGEARVFAEWIVAQAQDLDALLWLLVFAVPAYCVYVLVAALDRRKCNVAAWHYSGLAVLSAVMFVGTGYAASTSGLSADELMCVPVGGRMHASLRLWLLVFHLSKYWELVDTVVIFARQRELKFLHPYHHAIVLVQSWTWLRGELSFAFSGVMFNSFVHIFMYLLYALGSCNRRASWGPYVTSLQIVQFFVSFLLAAYYYVKAYTVGCEGVSWLTLSIGFNASLFVMFMQLRGKAGKGPRGTASKPKDE